MLKLIILCGIIFLFLAILCLGLSKLIQKYSSYDSFMLRRHAIFWIYIGILVIILIIAGS